MIARESFRKFRFIDLLAVLCIAVLWMVLSTALNRFLGPQWSYGFSLLLATLLMSFTVHLVRKAGAATLFYLIGAALTLGVDDIGILGMDKMIVLGIAGIIFEVVYIIFKLEFKSVKLDTILATAISSASIPISMSLLLSLTIALDMLKPAVNLILYSFFIGIIGAVLSFVLWYLLRTTHFVLRFEYN